VTILEKRLELAGIEIEQALARLKDACHAEL
jgi:hypothetical protein